MGGTANAQNCSDLVEAYDRLPEKASVLLDQTDRELAALGVNLEDSEVCGPACLVNFAELVTTARNLPSPDKKVLLERLLAHFDGKNIDARRGCILNRYWNCSKRRAGFRRSTEKYCPSERPWTATAALFI